MLATTYNHLLFQQPMILLFTAASLLAALLVSAGLNWLALIPWRRSTGAHWTERARRIYPARTSAVLNAWLIPVNVAIAVHLLMRESALLWLPPAVAAWLGATAGNYFVDRQIWPGVSLRTWAGQTALYAMFFQTSLLIIVVAMVAMPPDFGWQTWSITGAVLAIQLALVLGLTLRILRWTKLVQPAPADLRGLAEREAGRAGAKLRRVWIDRCPAAHAFALLPMKDMLFSERLRQLLSEDELAGVCAHEAAHLTESIWIFGGRLTALAALCPLMLIVPVTSHFGLLGTLLLLVLAVGLLRLPVRLARRMEQRADAAAVKQIATPAVYAQALEKIYEQNLLPAVMPKRSARTHPDLFDRMLAAGVTPSYLRPERPRKMSWTSFLLTIWTALQIALIVTLPGIEKAVDPDTSVGDVLFGRQGTPPAPRSRPLKF